MSTTPIQLPALEPPKYYSPFDARAKLANLQNLAQQQQIGQQSLEEGKLKLAEQQRLVGEGQQIRGVLQNSPDLRSALPNIYKINPVLGTSMMKSLHDQEKSELDMETARIGQSAAKAKRLASLAGSATDEASYHQAISKAVDEKLMSVQEANEHLAKGWGPQSQAEMQQTVQMGLTAEEQATQRLANLKEQRDALDAKHKRELEPFQVTQAQETARKTTLEADELQRKLDMIKNTKPSDVLALVDQVVPPDVKANHALSMRTKAMVVARLQQGDIAGAQDAIKTAAAEMRQLEVATDPRVQAAKVNVTVAGAAGRENAIAQAAGIPTAPATGAAADLHGEDYLKTLRPAFAARLRQMGAGDITAPTGRAATTGAGGQIMNALMQYDPTFNERRAQIRKAFTTGPDGRNIGNLNTATVHLDQLYDAAMAMKNGSFQPGNEAWNRLSTIFGSSMPTNFDALKVTVSGEMANALKGVATDPEIAHINETLSRAKSPEQLAGVVDEDLQSIAGKMNTYHERAQQQDVGKWSPVLPSARAVFQRHGIDPDTLKKTGAGTGGGAGPAGTIGVPLKSGRTAYMAPDAAAKFKRDHPELVK